MVATSQPLAAQSGLNVLRRGGNAIDAAIATMATMCVVEPCSTGIGGDAFALIWNAREQKLYGINGSGPAAQALDVDALRAEHGDTMPTLGGATVTVPGSIRAWQLALEKFGTQGLDTLLTDAIDYAENGFPVSPVIARAWAFSQEKMSRLPDSARVWLPNGKTPDVADLFRNPEFAQTLRAIANDGYDAFYTGDIAAQIVQAVQADGGYLNEDDLAGYDAEWVAPIAATYTNANGEQFEMHEIPPNGQGLTALLALNIVDGLELQRIGYGSVDYYHALIEATKLAFADAAKYIADPKHADIPLDQLLSIDYAFQRRQQLDFDRAQIHQPGNPNQHSDTVYLTTADGEGNMVSWIQSLYMGFGSGITAGTTGIQLQNRGANFTLAAGHANVAAPGKRPYHTIIPGFITKSGQAWSSFGVMGGFMQPQGHLQVGLNMMEFGMLPQDALDAPRFNWQKDDIVALETAIASGVQGALGRRGHTIVGSGGRWSYGGGQVIVRRDDGVLLGGTEPRKDGVVVAH